MVSPSNNQQFSGSPEVEADITPEEIADVAEQVDLNQIYLLIDRILPFEACLYYQVLPLVIEGSRLVIGMVNPDDLTASEYVKKQLSYINYSLSFKAIQSEWHRDLLSKYLNHMAQARQQPPEKAPPLDPEPRSPRPPVEDDDRNSQITYIVDQPDEIDDEFEAPLIAPTTPSSPESPVVPVQHSSPSAQAAPQTSAPPDLTEASHSSSTEENGAPLHLHLDDRYRNTETASITSLPPKALMQVLLNKVLKEGIGRLYFERRPQAGRILWSRDGILQAVVESIDPQIFQGVINEFKLLTHLSLIAVNKPRQVEIERLYKGERLLLRFRVMPNTHGEEATLQVLRGTALKFYQQQQIDKLGRDALDAAQALQLRLNDIRDRARQTLNFKPTRSETLPAIIELLKQMEAQVREIVAAYDLEERHTSDSTRDPEF